MRYAVDEPPVLLAAEPDVVGAYEAKTNLSRLLEEVAKGRSFLISKHGRPVARLLPVEPEPELAGVVDAMLDARAGVTLGNTSLSSLRAEGRR